LTKYLQNSHDFNWRWEKKLILCLASVLSNKMYYEKKSIAVILPFKDYVMKHLL
jgi:hypothetical protein